MSDVERTEHAPGASGPAPRHGRVVNLARRALLPVIMITSATFTVLATRHTSPTFDELTTMAVPAREFVTGRWDVMPNFPPLMQYLYGIPVYLSGPNYPVEPPSAEPPHRYRYAQMLLFESGNDPERLAFVTRLVAALFASVLVLLTYLFTRSAFGQGAGLLAAGLVAFLPDVMAHGGVAYNDIALAPLFLASVWALDRTVRQPSWRAGALAGLAISLAVAIKHSALVLGPIAIVIVLAEAAARTDHRRWLPPLAVSILAAIVVGYIVQVALYRGDFPLEILRASTIEARTHVGEGHGVPAYLLGRTSPTAWWYFYPVVFLFKTPAALHILMLFAIAGGVLAVRRIGSGGSAASRIRALLASPARAPLLAAAVFTWVLVTANLVIGFRYALPVLPLICTLTAAGVMVMWQRVSTLVRGAIVMLAIAVAASTLSYYPHFLAYTSEYHGDPATGYEVVVDSSLDWGQGLLELRDFMREENIPSVYLSYFGSALPEGYGIDYVRLPGYFPLPERPAPAVPPEFVAVSATHLAGMYLRNDPFAAFRDAEPYRVLGHTMLVYRVIE